MEKEEDIAKGNLDFGARIYNSQVGRWLGVDAYESEYPHLSPYSFVDNTPIGAIDPDGNHIIYLWNKDSPSGTGISGHSAVLVGNDQDGWTYYSNSGGGLSEIIDFKSIEEFIASDAMGYEKGIFVKTDREVDRKVHTVARREMEALVLPEGATGKQYYELTGNNCADDVKEAIEAGGIDMGERQAKLNITWPHNEFYNFRDIMGDEGTEVIFPQGTLIYHDLYDHKIAIDEQKPESMNERIKLTSRKYSMANRYENKVITYKHKITTEQGEQYHKGKFYKFTSGRQFEEISNESNELMSEPKKTE